MDYFDIIDLLYLNDDWCMTQVLEVYLNTSIALFVLLENGLGKNWNVAWE